jgi:Tol biopolymer transport system component
VALTSGTRLGPYEITAQIGAGGMGEVYGATDTKLKRQVALKVLPEAVASDSERLARFQREAEVLASLNHPHIAAIYGLEDTSDAKALVMELVEGPTLADRIAQGAIPVDEALPIAKQIAEALEAAHAQGIIHRDLKPANIKVKPDGTVKVLDFGLAKAMEPAAAAASPSSTMSPTITTPAMTQMGMILGTAAYMSPEQAKGRPADRRSDIWAFGAVLYEMLTGRRAFEGEDVSDTMASVLKADTNWSAVPTSVPPRVVTAMQRCLQRDPRQRIHDVGDLRLTLDGAFETAAPQGAAMAAAPPRPLWRRLIPVSTAVIVGLAAGYGAWQLRPLPVPAITRFALALPADQRFTNTGRQVVALSPDGSTLVYVANQRLYLRSMGSLEAHVISGSDLGAILNPVFSPDGQSVAFYTSNSLKRLAIAGGAAVTICPAQNVWGMSWDDSGIVFGQANQGILRVSPNGGVPEVIAAVGNDEVASNPQVLPGGKAVLFSVKKNTDSWDMGQVVVQPLPTGVRKTLIDGGADGRYVSTGHLVYALSGVLFAVPFDLRGLAVTGGPAPVVNGVRRAGLNEGATGTTQFSYSTTGSMAYLPGPATANVGAVRLAVFDNRNTVRVLDAPPAHYQSPRVSPDGTSVAVDTDDGNEAIVWVYDLSGTSAIRRLTFGGKNRAPVWSPDGQWVAYQSDREGDLAIYRQRADGSGTPERLTKPGAGEAQLPDSWSPDGAHLLFSVKKEQQFTLWVLSVTDRQVTRFSDLPSEVQFDATFSPDGRWVAYASRALADPLTVYLQAFPPSPTKYLVPQEGGHPIWLGSGQLLLNEGPDTSSLIAVRTDPQVSFGPPMNLAKGSRLESNPTFSRRRADAMPDGEHVLGLTTDIDSGSTSAIVVTLNWFTELKQRVPTR